MEQKTLCKLADIIILEMKKAGFADGTIKIHKRTFKRILRLAKKQKKNLLQ